MIERFRAAGAGALLLIGLGCASSGGVTRIAAGHRIEGRFIADEAYAAYVSGVVLESEGRLDAARAAYEEAIRYDGESPELWTRLGALRCRTQPGSAGAWEAFSRAVAIDESYEEAWTERARCHLHRGELPTAIADAKRAVALDPERTDPVLVLVDALERQGEREQAKRWLMGMVAREPGSIEAHEAALAFAARTGDAALELASRRALAELRAQGGMGPARADSVDAALTRGDFDRARRLGVSARISSGSLALRAAALGQVRFARDQAELVVGADPSDSDARVAAIVAADLARDNAALLRALSDLPDSFTPLSTLATLLMGEVLRRRVGEDAAGAFGEATGARASDDPLVRAVAGRK